MSEVLKIINEIPKAIILITTSIIFAKILLEDKKIKLDKNKIIAIITSIILYSIIISHLDGTVKTLILTLLYVVLYRILFKTTYSDCIFIAFMHIILIIIPDTLYLLFVIYVLKINPEICYSQFSGALISNLVVCGLLILLVYIFRKWLKKLLNIKIDKDKQIIIYTILTLGCILIIFYNAFLNVKFNKNLLLSTLVMVTFVIILYSLIRQKIENNKIVDKYDKLLEFIKKYEIEIDEQKSLRHESKNQLITIKTKLIEKQASKDIIEYIDSLIDEHKGYSEDKYGKFQYLPANGLKGLFYYKAMEAEEKKIKLSINVSEKVENSFLENLKVEDFKQLGRLIGIYLDNAIEASVASKKKQMGIEIYVREENILMIISNTYDGEIDIESVGKVKYTTKGKNHGYGLMLANRILKDNEKFIAERKISKGLYEQKLTIKKSI